MQVSVILSDDQMLQVSKDMQAAMPAIIAQAVPQLVAQLLTEAGSMEERKAWVAKQPPISNHWEEQRRVEGYVTLRQSVINALVPEAREAFAKHPELANVAQVLALYVVEHKREIMAEGFERFFNRMWTNLAQSSAAAEVMSHGLVQILKDKNFLRPEEVDALRSQVQMRTGDR